MKQKLRAVLRAWGQMVIELTIVCALVWPLVKIFVSILIYSEIQAPLHEQLNFPVILKNFWNGGLMGFGLGLTLGSFNLLFLFHSGIEGDQFGHSKKD